MTCRISFVVLLAALLTPIAIAEKNISLAPRIAEPGTPQVNETFENPLASPLTAVKGQWEVVDEILIGKELESDKHAAVLNYQLKNRNSVVRFSFRLDGTTKGFNLSLNHAKGHLFRVIVSPTALSVNLDKDKKDPTSKTVVLGSAEGRFQQKTWYTMQVEIQGDRVVAQTDNGLLVEATHPTLDTDKPNYRFVMKGDSLSLDDLRIREIK